MPPIAHISTIFGNKKENQINWESDGLRLLGQIQRSSTSNFGVTSINILHTDYMKVEVKAIAQIISLFLMSADSIALQYFGAMDLLQHH